MRSRRPSDRLIERCEAVPLAVSQAVAGVGGVVLLALPAARVPIGVAMLAVALGDSMIVTGVEPTLQSLRSAAYDTFASYTFSIVPLFLLMGEFATQAGLSEALFRSANAWLGQRRGGIAMATIGGSAGFGAIAGSSLATAVTMARVALPEMRRYGYSGALAAIVVYVRLRPGEAPVPAAAAPRDRLREAARSDRGWRSAAC